MKQLGASFNTNTRKPSAPAPKLNNPVKPAEMPSKAPEPIAPSVERRKKSDLEGKLMRSKKSKLEELNSQALNSQGEVVAFIQAFFPK